VIPEQNDFREPRFNESAVVSLLADYLVESKMFTDVRQEVSLGSGDQLDLVATNVHGTTTIIEVKARAPQTMSRLDVTIQKLRVYEHEYFKEFRERPLIVLALPFDQLTVERTSLLQENGVTVWDKELLSGWIANSRDSLLKPELDRLRTSYVNQSKPKGETDIGNVLSRRLRALPSGKAHWSEYQRLCSEILQYLFCPPLELPLYEVSNAAKNNRRDIILPNYATEGFWSFLHRAYQAEYIVVDAKNYRSEIKKTQVLQMANYLSEAGTGLLGIIITRKDEDRGALTTRREQWLIYRKMLVVMGDNDVQQMIENKRNGSAPEELLRQKIQDFRLAI
jgi:hypothetical protein